MNCFIRPLCLLLATVLLGGCSVLPEPRSQYIYRLPPSTVGVSQGQGIDVALRIARPSAGGLLDGARIVVVPESNQFSVYQDARWYSQAPLMWRDHLLDSFRNDGRIRRLSSDGDGVQPDFELGGTLRAFQSEYHDGVPHVVISIDARLVDNGNKRIISGSRFTVTEAVRGTQVPEVVAAFGKASDTLAEEIIDWTCRQLQKNRQVSR
ncbi:MAG: ABC transporter [Desulfuromonadaceae bacterium]|nr:ABC transporter [Desulfuromonadaceae bacterium]